MGYLDGLKQSGFATDEDGTQLFYPWGVLGRGYRLADEHAAKNAKRLVTASTWITLTVILSAAVVRPSLAGLLTMVGAIYVVYTIGAKVVTAHLETAQAKITTRDHLQRQAAAYGRTTLTIMIVLSALMAAGILLMAIYGNSHTTWAGAVLWFAAIFFAACSGFCYFLRRLTQSSEK